MSERKETKKHANETYDFKKEQISLCQIIEENDSATNGTKLKNEKAKWKVKVCIKDMRI